MNVCLVTAPTATEFSNREELSSSAVLELSADPQLGVLTLAAVLENRGNALSLADLNRLFLAFMNSGEEPAASGFVPHIAQDLARRDARLFGFSSICSTYPLTIRIAQELKTLRQDARILLGGPQASVVDVETMTAFPFIDFILRGEADLTLPLLLDELEGPERLDRVPGLTYRQNSAPRRNPNGTPIADLDRLPSPAYHLTGELKGASRATLELGRGCPFACTFCSTNDFFRRSFRLRSPARVLQDMRAVAASYSIRNFELVHDMFTIDRRRVTEFCNAMIESGEGFLWACSARTDRVDEELLELMYRAGCRSIFYGVETGSARMQRIIDKHLDPLRAAEIVRATDHCGIRSTVSFIAGFPEETRADLGATVGLFLDAARFPHSKPQLNLLAPLAATPVHARHRHEIILEELCSDMSHQGQTQQDQDVELIRKHPEIFPNFYLLPTPHLDRGSLIELHEFMHNAVARIRYLLCALQQAGDFLAFFDEWRAERLLDRVGGDLRHYYRTGYFVADFLAFAGRHNYSADPFVAFFASFYTALRGQKEALPAPSLVPVQTSASLEWTDIPARKPHTLLVELEHEMEPVVWALRNRAQFPCNPGRYFYATEDIGAEMQLFQISDWTAALLHAADGTKNMEEVLFELAGILDGIEPSLQAYALVELVKAAQTGKFLEIYRNSSDADASQEGTSGSCEYSEISSAASRENHSSIPRQYSC